MTIRVAETDEAEELTIRALLAEDVAQARAEKLSRLRERRGDTTPAPNPYNSLCPLCSQPAVRSCRCKVGEKTCAQGHTWVTCPIDKNRIVPATDTHSSGMPQPGTCWCSLGQVYPPQPGKMARAAKSNAKVVEVPASFAPVVLEPAKATRKEFPFEGFIDFQGIKIDVENAKGSTRTGEGPEGPWATHMFAHYGEIRGTEATDGDKLDVYVGDNHDSSLVVVIHQHNPWDGQYDEDKVVLGCESVEEAIGLYKKQYDRPGFFKEKEYTAMPIGAFWRWVQDERNHGKRVKHGSAVLKITAAEVMRRLKTELWRPDRHDQSYEQRIATFYAVNFVHMRHTGTKKELFKVVWYTGNPAHRWSSKTVDDIKEAVDWANKVKPEADRISAEELGESPVGKLAGRAAVMWKKGYAEGQPGVINAAKAQLAILLGALRAMAFNYQTSHWQVTGDAFYSDHQLFDRLYGTTNGEVDGLAEKMVGLFGKEAVDGPAQAKVLVTCLQAMSGVSDPLTRGLQAEQQFQLLLAGTRKTLKDLGQLSMGLDDMLPALANTHDSHVYLLQQRLSQRRVATVRVPRDPTKTLTARYMLRWAAKNIREAR